MTQPDSFNDSVLSLTETEFGGLGHVWLNLYIFSRMTSIEDTYILYIIFLQLDCDELYVVGGILTREWTSKINRSSLPQTMKYTFSVVVLHSDDTSSTLPSILQHSLFVQGFYREGIHDSNADACKGHVIFTSCVLW